jgi:hypothetical protein
VLVIRIIQYLMSHRDALSNLTDAYLPR